MTSTTAGSAITHTITHMGAREWAMLVFLSVLWGGSFFFVGTLVDNLRPFTIVALRVGLAAIVLWPVVLITGRRLPREPGVWAAFLIMGAINNAIPFSLIAWGQTGIASGVASILTATTPIFTVLVAGTLLPDERITRLKLAGIATGIIGIAVMIGPQALAGLSGDALPQLAILGAAISYACAATFGRRFKRMGVDPVVVATGQVSAAALILAPLALGLDRPFANGMPGPGVWAAVGGLAALSTALAYIIYFRLLETAGATNLMLVTLLVPVFAILLGAMFLGETLDAGHIAGMVLIGFGLLVIDGRIVRRIHHPT